MSGSPYTCDECGSESVRSEKHDAYFCRKCNVWLEPICPAGDECSLCRKRPEKPNMETTK